MPMNVILLERVPKLGQMGDVVKVKPGFARNYLLPHGFAEAPTPEKIEALKDARAAAQAELAKVRAAREALMARMEGVGIKLIRSVNDQGVLYGAVTQRDIADQLVADGFGVEFRAVRLQQTIRRIGHYSCTIQLDRDLKTDISIDVLPDRTLEILTAAADAPAEEPEAEEAPAAEAPAAEAEAKAEGKKGKKAKA